jgi:GNAT superfamily N-acetyltransferase
MHADYQAFLLFEHGQIIGRIFAYVNHAANEYWKSRIGLFGHYDCINNGEAAYMLLKTAEDWMRDQGMESMRGQWNLITQDMGFIYEGFDLNPVVLSSYNPRYYNDHMVQNGMKKCKDLLVYNCDTSQGYQIPDRFLDLTDKISRRYGVTVRTLNMNNLLEDVRIIVQLTNVSLQNNWGYYPVDDSEAEKIAEDMRMIIQPEVILIAEVEGKPIGYVLTVPDVNEILEKLHGRLLPLGIFKLLRGIKKINRYRIWAMGFLPSYQRKGISVLLFRRLNELLAPKGAYVEINWVLEDNDLMNNALIKLELDVVKRYRIYEKKIL